MQKIYAKPIFLLFLDKKIVSISLIILLSSLTLYGETALWVVRDALKSDKHLDRVIDIANDIGCKTIFLQVRALGEIYYETDTAIPSANNISLSDFFVRAAQANVDIHFWINSFYVASGKKLKPNHILKQSTFSEIYSIDNKEFSKVEGKYVHPNDERNLSEIKTIIKELLKKYPAKGIHFDYFRYPGYKNHFSKTGRSNFLVKYGFDPEEKLNPKELNYRILKNHYNDFLNNELTAVLEELNRFIKNINKDLMVSIAVKPNYITAKFRYHQDWKFWLDNDLCDFVVVMNYNPDFKKFLKNLEILPDIHHEKIMVGIPLYNIENNQIFRRINFINNTNFKGMSLFSYNVLINKKNLLKELKTELLNEPRN